MSSAAAPASVTLHSTWRGFIGTIFGASILLATGAFAVAVAGWRLIPTSILIIGVIAVMVVLFDYPIATTFDARGAERRMAFRRQLIPWDDVSRIVRARPSFSLGIRKFTHGGFTAIVGRRRYLLVDTGEGLDEFDRLDALIEQLGHDVEFDAVQPPREGATATWTYRRRKWMPDDYG